MALIGCNTSPHDVTWALHCVNNTWQGMEKNCIRQQLNSRWPVAVALVSGGVLIMLAVLSVVTVCYFYRSRNSQQIVQSENQAMPPDLPISAQNSCRIEVPSPQCDNYFLGQLNNNISLMADPEPVYPPPPRESYLAQLEAGYTKQDNDGSNDLEHSLTPPPTPPPSYPENVPPPPPTVAPPPPLDMASYTGEALYSVETEPGKCGQVINGMLQLEEPHYYDIN